VANFILCDLEGVDAPTLVERSRRHGLYLRAFPTTPSLRWGAVRIAVKDGRTNQRMASILRDVLERELTGRRGVPAATVEALAAL
jgi:histidinol-phosphate/aromatic aminotransferase/cobyric acid decarboxylase-like protein